MTELEKARQIINETDEKMAELFEKRMAAAEMVADYKRQNGLRIDDFSREAELIKRNTELIKNESYKPFYVSFLRSTIDVSKKLQHSLIEGMRVAFSGIPGAFADITAQKIFPDATTVPYGDFKAAYNSVKDGESDVAVLPVENSFNGDVGTVLDLVFFGPLYINGIYESEIVQNLLAKPGSKIKDIKEVISHPQALGQCAEFIEKHGFKTVSAVNTAVAAETVAESSRNDIAAIASEQAAENTGLVNIAPHINDASSNTTRFAVFSRSRKAALTSDNHFVMVFTVKNVAGALGKAISVIGESGFNLRAIKSRPTKALVWDYYFYAEGEGNINGQSGRNCLDKLKKCCDNLRVIGSFEKEIRL